MHLNHREMEVSCPLSPNPAAIANHHHHTTTTTNTTTTNNLNFTRC